MDWADKKADEIVRNAFGYLGSKQKQIAQALREAYVRGIKEGDGLSVRNVPAITPPPIEE
jgi:hypothetical protein